MRVTTISAHSLTAEGVHLGAEISADTALGYPSRALYIGPLILVTTARNDDAKAWREASDAAEKLAESAENMSRWALAQAEAADDLKAQRETVAQARRIADFGEFLGPWASQQASA